MCFRPPASAWWSRSRGLASGTRTTSPTAPPTRPRRQDSRSEDVTALRIGRIETFFVPPRWLFVRVETEDGAFGWGEASLEGWAEAVEGTFAAFRDRFIG